MWHSSARKGVGPARYRNQAREGMGTSPTGRGLSAPDNAAPSRSVIVRFATAVPSTHFAPPLAATPAALPAPLLVLVPIVRINTRTPGGEFVFSQFVCLVITPTILFPLAHRHTFTVRNQIPNRLSQKTPTRVNSHAPSIHWSLRATVDVEAPETATVVVQGSSEGGANEPPAGGGATRRPQGASNPDRHTARGF